MVGVALIRTEVLVTTKRFAKRQIDGSSSDESTHWAIEADYHDCTASSGRCLAENEKQCVFRMFAIFCNAIQIVPNTKHVAWKWPFCYTFCQQWKFSLITDTYVKWLGGVSTFRDKIHCLTLCAAHLEPRPSCPQIPCLATISTAKRAAWTGSTPMRVLEARYPSSLSKLNISTWCLMMFRDVSWFMGIPRHTYKMFCFF